MNKARWLEAQWPVKMVEITRLLSENLFDNENDDGFILHRTRKDRVEGCHVEKISFEEKGIDPFGNEYIQHRILYKRNEFILRDKFPQIEIHNPQRGLVVFLERLSESLGFEAVISPLEVDLVSWIKKTRPLFDGRIEIRAIQASEIEFMSGVFGEIIAKSSMDLSGKIDNLINRKTSSVKKINAYLKTSVQEASLVFSHNAVVAYPEALEESFLPLLRDSLAQCLNK